MKAYRNAKGYREIPIGYSAGQYSTFFLVTSRHGH